MMVAGLSEIDPAFNIFGIPFFFETDAELACVQKKMTTDALAEARGEEVST